GPGVSPGVSPAPAGGGIVPGCRGGTRGLPPPVWRGITCVLTHALSLRSSPGGAEQTPERCHVRGGLQTSHALGKRVKPVLRQHTAPQFLVFGKQLVPRQGILRIALRITYGSGHLAAID